MQKYQILSTKELLSLFNQNQHIITLYNVLHTRARKLYKYMLIIFAKLINQGLSIPSAKVQHGLTK